MPPKPTPDQETLGDLREIMRRLRDPNGGCPWDLEQDFATIAPYTIEEAYEVADAIARGHMPDLCEELGDLLLQVVFHAQMAQEAGHFTLDDVIASICHKMIRRHPHVFGDAAERTVEGQTLAWEEIKAQERAEKSKVAQAKAAQADHQIAPEQNQNTRSLRSDGALVPSVLAGVPSVLDDVPLALPALMRAEKLSKRAARLGFDWPNAESVLEKLYEEIEETREEIKQNSKSELQNEIGDVLFTVVNLARKSDIDPEEALRQANTKFSNRFRYVESEIHKYHSQTGQSPSLEQMETYWRSAKRVETFEPSSGHSS